MADQSQIRQLQTPDNQINVFPITLEKCISDSNGMVLSQKMTTLQSDIATVEPSSTSAHAYAVGDYLMYSSQLYKVTQAIAVGDTIAVGVNVAAAKISDSLGGGKFVAAYIVGQTVFADDWLSDSVSGAALAPDPDELYLVLTNGSYQDRMFRWNGTVYEEVSPSAGGYVFVYIVGNTALAFDWLSLTPSGAPLTPHDDILYTILTSGDYENYIVRYDFSESSYVVVSTPTNKQTVMVGATANEDGKSGVVPQPMAGDQADVLLGNGTWGDVPVMIGATSAAAGKQGAVPQPLSSDRSKALFGDGEYHTIYSAASGSTVMVITTESALYGRTVTLTDGVQTSTATIQTVTGTNGTYGQATFTDVQMSGGVTVSATDSSGNEAKGSGNLTYFGTYYITITSNFATLNITTSDTDLFGQTVRVYFNNNEVGQTAFSALGVAQFYAESIGAYTLKAEGGGRHAQARVTVTALKTAYSVSMFLYYIYTYQIDHADSDPASCVTPYESDYGCDNLNYVSAHMDFTNDAFVYGSWGTQFFWPKSCMLNQSDGTVAYYLDEDDETKRSDGATASDVANWSCTMNAMVEWPTIYFKRWTSGTKEYCLISDRKLDADFHAYAHHDINGNVLPYIYLAKYDGMYLNGVLRSLSGAGPSNNNSLTNGKICCRATRQNEIDYAAANGLASGCEGWAVTHKADWDMVNSLLILISMRLDMDVAFGRGRDSGYSSASNTGQISTGSMNGKGQFWGESNGGAGVKVFGIENWYGNIWKNIMGWMLVNGTQKIKMTYGQEDGSTVDGFNTTGNEYVSIGNSAPSGTNGGYISSWKCDQYGFIPLVSQGSATTFVCDGLWFNNSGSYYAIVGGDSSNGALVGAFCSILVDTASDAGWGIGAALSYKSLV